MFKIEAIEEFFKQIPSDIKGAALKPVKNCVNFSGRAPRSDIFGFLFVVALCTLCYVVFVLNILFLALSFGVSILSAIFIGVMYLSLTARRLHDINKSAWWCIIFLVPYLGMLLWLLLFFVEGDKGNNQYGPDPLKGKQD